MRELCSLKFRGGAGASPGAANSIAACRGNSENNKGHATHEAASVRLKDCSMELGCCIYYTMDDSEASSFVRRRVENVAC